MNAEKRQVALVTGGTRGIGFGCAAHLAAAGFDLAVNGIREENSVAADLDRLRQAGGDVIYCRGDVAESSDRKDMLARIQDHFGRLHVLVNNAGVAPLQRLDILETTEESLKIADEGKQARAAAAAQLVSMEGELRAALAAAKSRAIST